MTERLTITEYNKLTGQVRVDAPLDKKVNKKAELKRKLILSTTLNEIERTLGIRNGGIWKKGMAVEPDTMYLEYPGIEDRKFRFDVAIPSRLIACEIHGGSFVKRASGSIGGAHHSIEGRFRDMEKSRLAQLEGWMVLEVTWEEIADGTTFNLIQKGLKVRIDG